MRLGRGGAPRALTAPNFRAVGGMRADASWPDTGPVAYPEGRRSHVAGIIRAMQRSRRQRITR